MLLTPKSQHSRAEATIRLGPIKTARRNSVSIGLRREHDTLPYRAVGPVTEDEYLSREERYDKQLVEVHQVDINAKTTAEKIAILRELREEQYETLKDAVYKRRGWTPDGIPTVATVRRLEIDFPEVLDLLKSHGVT